MNHQRSALGRILSMALAMGASPSPADEEYLTGKQPDEKPSKLFNRVADWIGRKRAADLAHTSRSDTRQRKRSAAFQSAFYEITQKYGGESRKTRRAIARDLSKRRIRANRLEAAA